MIITVTPNANTQSPAITSPYAPYYLAGVNPTTGQPDGRFDPDNYQMRPEVDGQLAEYFRASNASFLDRGNLRYTITFTVHRPFTSMNAAFLFWHLHSTLCPTSGLVTIYGPGDSSNPVVLYCAQANVLVTPQGSWIGQSTDHSYQITTGTITNTAP